MSRHEAPEVEAMVGRMLRALVRRAGEGDTEALEALVRLEDLAGLALSVGMAQAHTDQGGLHSWTEIADAAGQTRQGARQRAMRALASGRERVAWLRQPRKP